MYHSVLIHSFTDGHLCSFQHFAMVNCTIMNIRVHRFFWIGVSGLLEYNPGSRIVGSKGSSILSFLMKFHTVFHNGCTSLHSHQQCVKIAFSLHPHQHLFVDFFLKRWGVFLWNSDTFYIAWFLSKYIMVCSWYIYIFHDTQIYKIYTAYVIPETNWYITHTGQSSSLFNM